MNIRGFTLIELLITIAIIGILAGVAVTAYVGTTKKAARSEAYSNLESLRLLEEEFFADYGDYTTNADTTCAKDHPENVTYIQQGGSSPDPDNALPGFKPGQGENLQFSYCIEHDIDLNGNAQEPCFRASAFGNSNTRVDGDVFRIDCNNNRNF